MRLRSPVNARRIFFTFLALSFLTLQLFAHPVIAQSPSPRADGLDTPLTSVNRCGAGNPNDVHFTIAATGDTLLHRNIQAAGQSQGYDYLFDHIRPFLQVADLGYTNIEGAMVEGSGYSGFPTFNYNPALAPALKKTGIDVVSSANNHIMDRGPEGVDATLNVLEEAGLAQHGAVPTSAVNDPRPPYTPITLTRNGESITIAFLSFTWGTNGLPDPHNQINLIWESSDYGQQGATRQETLDAIRQAKRETDFVIVTTHWGVEYVFYPMEQQKVTAALMAAAGADVILGGHPHTLQPVDLIDTNGHETLVIYSLGNFIASQGIYNATSFTSTSVIFYVGLVRQADGHVRLTGFRYLPTTVIDYDTRPAPLPPQGAERMLKHVRLMMRDPHGALQVTHDPALLGEHLNVCPTLVFPEAGNQAITGDFAQYFTTLGSGTTPRAMHESLSVVGYPLGEVVQELSGDCRNRVNVLYTQRQRLELHPQHNWPNRVVGTQLGTAVYKQKYGLDKVRRHRDWRGNAIIVDEDFRTFFERYGGVPVFGYPISGKIIETDAQTGKRKTVQYFERARFELVAEQRDNPDLLQRVHLGLLSEEYAGIEAQCGIAQRMPTVAPRTGDQPHEWPTPTAAPRLPAGATHPHPQPGNWMLAAHRDNSWWGWMTLTLGIVGLVDSGLRLRK
jgi:hypothetical protein